MPFTGPEGIGPVVAADRQQVADQPLPLDPVVQQQAGRLHVEGEGRVGAEIEAELENIRAAWHWAIEHRNIAALEQSLESLYHFYYNRGLLQEGEEAFREAAESLEESVTLAKLLARQGVFAWSLHHLDLSEEVSERSLAILARLGKPPDVVALINLACAPAMRGELDLAEQRNFELLEASRHIGNLWGMACALNNMGDIANARGAFGRTIFERKPRSFQAA
jgi:hypothetical protein